MDREREREDKIYDRESAPHGKAGHTVGSVWLLSALCISPAARTHHQPKKDQAGTTARHAGINQGEGNDIVTRTCRETSKGTTHQLFEQPH